MATIKSFIVIKYCRRFFIRGKSKKMPCSNRRLIARGRQPNPFLCTYNIIFFTQSLFTNFIIPCALFKQINLHAFSYKSMMCRKKSQWPFFFQLTSEFAIHSLLENNLFCEQQGPFLCSRICRETHFQMSVVFCCYLFKLSQSSAYGSQWKQVIEKHSQFLTLFRVHIAVFFHFDPDYVVICEEDY